MQKGLITRQAECSMKLGERLHLSSDLRILSDANRLKYDFIDHISRGHSYKLKLLNLSSTRWQHKKNLFFDDII